MKPIEHFDIMQMHDYVYSSPLCSAAASIDYPHPTPVRLYAQGLTYSYFNQWQLVVDAYSELHKMHSEVNTVNDKAIGDVPFSEYDIVTTLTEDKFRDYAFLLITSMKSLFDLSACLVDVIVNQTIREEHRMVDFNKIKHVLDKTANRGIIEILEKYDNKDWMQQLKEARNRIVHRGYRCRPDFGFTKNNDLEIKLWQGTSFVVETISIGQLFESFATDLPRMETELTNELLRTISYLSGGLAVRSSYKNAGSFISYDEQGIRVI